MDASSASEAGEVEELSYRQRLEKAAGGDIVLMEWCPAIDLLAAAMTDNSVVVNRLSWQRVWTLQSQGSVKPTSLSWRPDGKILAVGRSDGSVSLIGVEDGETLHSHSFPHSISSLYWLAQDQPSADVDCVEYKDRSISFLPPLPSLDSSELVNSSVKSSCLKQVQPLSKELDILLVGNEAGVVHMCVGGVWCATDVHTADSSSSGVSHVMATCLSADLSMLSTVNLNTNTQLHLQLVEVDLIKERCRELRQLATHCSHICSLLSYASDTLCCMQEAWEDVLMEVDTKLAEYSATLKEGRSIADELLVLLACGRARPELRDFLLDELTAKGVKKIGLSLEISYTRVRKYSLTCLSSVIQALQFHLGELVGVARWRKCFGSLGISVDKLEVCIKTLGAFALKNQELQLVIDESLLSMKAFFKWIYVVILKLEEEPVPNTLKESLTAEELKSVVHFLRKRLAKSAAEGAQNFNLEMVGQYLADEDLKITEERAPTFWERLVQDADLDIEAVPWLFSAVKEKSLLQLLNSLTRDIHTALSTTKEPICKTFVPKPSLPLIHSTIDGNETLNLSSKIGELMCEGKRCVYCPCDGGLFLLVYRQELNCSCCRVCLRDVSGLPDQAKSEDPLNILSVKVYNSETLSILFEYTSSERDDVPFFAIAQLPVKPVLNLATDQFGKQDLSESHDIGSLLTQLHSLGPFQATSLAVSGSRHLAAVFSQQTKMIRLFDVDAEEEEEEEEEGEG